MKTLFTQKRFVQLVGLVVFTIISLGSYSNTADAHISDLLLTRADTTIDTPQICIVVLDRASRKNLIAWERKSSTTISGYNVYRESPLGGIYDSIGNVPYDSISQFVDSDSDPKLKSYRYKISTVETGGNESVLSDRHQTVFLSVYQEGQENLLDWSYYEGFSFDYYKIYRGPTPDSMTLIDSVSSMYNFYTDFLPPSGLLFYQISLVKADPCYPSIIRGVTSTGPYSQSVSNLKDYSNSPTDYLLTSANSLNIDESGGPFSLDVFTTLSTWNVNSDQSWLTVSTDTVNNLIMITAASNSSTSERSATITVSGNNVTDYTISVSQSGKPVSVSKFVNQENITVYPNPSNGKFNLSYNTINPSQRNLNINIYNMHGQLIYNEKLKTEISGSYLLNVDLFDVPKGMYLLVFKHDAVIERNKIIIK